MSEDSITQAVHQFKTSREFKSDRIGNIPVAVGKVWVGGCGCVRTCARVRVYNFHIWFNFCVLLQLDFPDEHIVENISCVLGGVVSHHGNLPKSTHCS